MAQSGIALIAGLGNPGDRYTDTRHNAGFWFIERLQYRLGFTLRHEKRFRAEVGTATLNGQPIRIVVPDTFMNLSGEAVAPLASFYRIPPSRILVVHDELDLPAGVARLKRGGGHGGHNGLRDIVSRLGSPDFVRLRLGIGRPPAGHNVESYVLRRPDTHDRMQIERAIDEAMAVIEDVIQGDLERAMTALHTENPPATGTSNGL